MNSPMISLVPLDERPEKKIHGSAITGTIRQYLYHWPLFLVSLFITLSAGLYYLRVTSPVYEIKARLLIKDPIRGVSSEPALAELDFIRTNSVIENELEILKSRSLMDRVVDDLQLWTTYEKVDRFAARDLYKSTPVRLVLISGYKEEIRPHTFELTLLDQNSFLLKQGKNSYPVEYSSRLVIGRNAYRLEPAVDISRYKGWEMNISVVRPQEATTSYLERVVTAPISKLGSMLEISLEDNVPERGTDVLNRLIHEYDLASVQYKNRVTASTLKFMDVRLDSLARELGSIEKDVARFKSSKALTEISTKSQFYLENARENDQKLNDVEVQLNVIEDLERSIRTSGPAASPASAGGIADANLTYLIEQLNSLRLQREKLLATTPEKNPLIQTLNNQIESLKASINDNISNIKSSLNTTKKQLRTFESGFDASIRDIPVEEREYISIKRQQGIKEDLYVYLLKKREEAGLSYASTLADSRTVDKAFYGSPVSPNPGMILGAACLLGLVIPVGIVFGRNFFNGRILNAHTIKESTSVPIIAEIVKHSNTRAFALTDDSSRILSEQFRILRTNLNHLCKKEFGRVIMLTSGMASEGKSFISCNLGLALAAYGKKTVILEFDLRQPGISRHFELTSETGLSEYLKGEASFEEIVQPSGIHPDLFVVRAGRLTVNPSDLLGSPRLRRLMDCLQFQFQDIIIDTPPIHLVADAMIVSEYADINLYVIRQGFTYRSELEYVKQLQDDQKLKNMNIIFNGVEMSARYNYKINVDYNYYSAGAPRKLSISSTLKSVARRF